jgi:hypothetical protein
MVVGELLPMPDSSHSDPRADDIRECLELLKPKMLPEELLQAETPEDGGPREVPPGMIFEMPRPT